MNTDIRIDVEFYAHPKTRKLKRRLGSDGIIALQMLWIWCAKNRPDGNLAGLDEDDIELASDWDGDAGAFVSALVDLRWLDHGEGGYSIHDWKEHNPWAADADNRGDKARLSRLARANPDAYARYKTEGRTGISETEYQDAIHTVQQPLNERSTNVVRTYTNRSTPAPSPDPDPKPKPTPSPKPPSPAPPADDGDDVEPVIPVDLPAVVEPAPPPDGVEHLTLSEACDLYRQSFPGKNHLMVAPLVMGKLGVWASKYSREQMLGAFQQAAAAGATSVNYLEAVLTGQGKGRASPKPPSKTEEAKERLAAWARDDWLRKEIAVGVMRMWAEGLSGRPAADVLAVTAANFEDELRPYQLTPEETDRVATGFVELRKHCDGKWPHSRLICDFLPRRREQKALEENTAPKVELKLMEGFQRIKEEMRSENQAQG